MPLFADEIGLRQPRPEVSIDLAELAQTKNVHVVAGRNGLDPAKAWVLQPPREHDMSSSHFCRGVTCAKDIRT